MVIVEYKTPESMQGKQRYKDEFHSYVEEHLDERMRLNPELTMEDVVCSGLNLYTVWRGNMTKADLFEKVYLMAEYQQERYLHLGWVGF